MHKRGASVTQKSANSSIKEEIRSIKKSSYLSTTEGTWSWSIRSQNPRFEGTMPMDAWPLGLKAATVANGPSRVPAVPLEQTRLAHVSRALRGLTLFLSYSWD